MPSALPPRVILLASARTYRVQPFLEAAHMLGLEVVLGQDVPLPMLKKVEAGLPLDYRDLRVSTEAIVRYAEEHPVGAIVAVDDSGTLLAARASQALGLPTNSPEDLILYKLRYFAISEQDKHIRDIASILGAVRDRLDQTYLDKWAFESGLQNTWAQVRKEVHRRFGSSLC